MTTSLRVLMVSDVSPLEVRGGAERVLWEQASRLAGAGHRVRVLSRSPEAGESEAVERQGVRIRHFSADRRSFLRFFVDSLIHARQMVREEIVESGPDILHLHQPLSGFGALSTREGQRIPSLYTFHSPAALEYRSRQNTTTHHLRGLVGGLGMAGLWLLEGFCLRRASHIQVLSDFSAGLLRKIYRIGPARIVKIPGGVNSEHFRPAEDRNALRNALRLPTGRFLLLTVRNLEPRMGLDALIQAMAIVRREIPDVLLLIGGAGSLRANLESLASSLTLRDHVRFLEFISEAELPLYYQVCDAFVLPTRELEGFGLVAVESLACGTPVLGTPVGAIPEMLVALQPNLLFDGVATESIARGILKHVKRAQGDRRGYEALRRRCRDYATARFGWDQVIKQLEQELLNLSGTSKQENGKG